MWQTITKQTSTTIKANNSDSIGLHHWQAGWKTRLHNTRYRQREERAKVLTFCAVRCWGAKTSVPTVWCPRPAAKATLELLWHSWCLPLHVSEPSWRTFEKQDKGNRGGYQHTLNRHTVHVFSQQRANLPAGLDSMYLWEVVIPYRTTSPDTEEESTLSYCADRVTIQVMLI